MDPAKAEAVAARVRARGGDARSAECNVADPAHAERAVRYAVDAFGELTTLVNVAATVIPDGNAETLSLDDWNKTLAVNLTGPFLMAKFAIPEIRKAGGGTIVNITSQLGQIGVPRKSPYSTSKAALIQLSKCLAVDYARDNIRVNSLSPGAIDTARSLRHFGTRENANKARGPLHLLGRTGRVRGDRRRRGVPRLRGIVVHDRHRPPARRRLSRVQRGNGAGQGMMTERSGGRSQECGDRAPLRRAAIVSFR